MKMKKESMRRERFNNNPEIPTDKFIELGQ
jgi:hypothetical protein